MYKSSKSRSAYHHGGAAFIVSQYGNLCPSAGLHQIGSAGSLPPDSWHAAASQVLGWISVTCFFLYGLPYVASFRKCD